MRFLRWGRGSDESLPVEPGPVTRVDSVKPRPVDPDPVEPDQPVVPAPAESAPDPAESAPAPPEPVAHDQSPVGAQLGETDPDVTPDDALPIETESAHLVVAAEAVAAPGRHLRGLERHLRLPR